MGQGGGFGSAVGGCSCPGSSWPDNGRKPGPRAAPAAAPAPPGLFPSHCPWHRKDVSSLLPFCLKGMWGGQGEEGICCARGAIAAPQSFSDRCVRWEEGREGLLLLCDGEIRPRKGVLAFGDVFSVDRARVVTKECCKVPPVFLHSSRCCGWAEAPHCAGGGRAPTCQEVKVELIKTGNNLNLFWLNPFSTSKPQRSEAKLLVGARPHLSRGSEVAVAHLWGFG